MPLPPSKPRKHIHTRAIDYRGYQREDGLWDIEAHMTDTKTYPIRNNWRGQLDIGEPLHEMLIRITIDNNFFIQDVWTKTENSPFEICPEIAPAYKNLVGIQMGPGWRKAIRQEVGGVCGCTHLTELLFPMATVAMQTIWPLQGKNKNREEPTNKSTRAPTVLNTCHAWESSSPVVKENAPKYYTGSD
tara:strand:- start:103 stop:666 length:564 start_codon:yes stop_codon:yes gene_type:complete